MAKLHDIFIDAFPYPYTMELETMEFIRLRIHNLEMGLLEFQNTLVWKVEDSYLSQHI